MTSQESGPPARAYSPSPRPTFAEPTLVTRTSVTRHVWGDDEAGEVMDWIYVSSAEIHALVFGLAPGGAFRHSREFRTVFGADELLQVLSGEMIIANPETGEVELVPAGGNVFFRANTWHHAFAHGTEPLRVLELFAPPPAAGTSGAYSRTRPYLEVSTYTRDHLLGALPASGHEQSIMQLRDADISYRLEGGALVGLLISTEYITVARTSLSPGARSPIHAHAGDEVLYGLTGSLVVRAWWEERTFVFEVGPDDAVYLPRGARHEYRNVNGVNATALVGVAPDYRDA